MSKQFVVVGGSHGIGLGIVHRLLERGDSVWVLSRTTGDLPIDAPGLRHVVADVTRDLPDGIMPETVDGLAYCPGSICLGPVRSIAPDSLVDEFQLNVVGAVRCVQAALRGLKKSSSGSIVMFSTVAVGKGMPMHSSVAAVKGAIEGLTRSMAAELAPGIRVNAIAPALVDTPLAERLLSSDEKRQAMGKRHPLGRVGTVDDIAAAATYLLSDESSWVTGQILGIDGGLSTIQSG